MRLLRSAISSMETKAERSLSGLEILVTRPEPAALCARIEALGGRAWPFPSIVIEATDIAAPTSLEFAYTIVTSQYAARYVPYLPAETHLIAIGPTTAQALQARGFTVQTQGKAGSDSESVLAMAPLQGLHQGRALLVSGLHGRTHLQSSLEAQGLEVEKWSVYQRACPRQAPTSKQLQQWQNIKVVVVTSYDAFKHLVHLLGPIGMPWLLDKNVCVPSQRVREKIVACGFLKSLIVSSGASDAAIIEAITREKLL